MKILTSEQIRQIDRYTVMHEPIASVDLMERAAGACVRRIATLAGKDEVIHVFCGVGNNGGDGLAITRLLLDEQFNCHAYLVLFRDTLSEDAETNFKRLKQKYPTRISEVRTANELPADAGTLAIDALLGTGVTKRTEGLLESAITHINEKYKRVISIDLPSGLFTEGPQLGQNIVRSVTLTLQLPKLALLLPENGPYVRQFELVDIGLSETAINDCHTSYYYVTASDVAPLLKPRDRFSHKGTYGHALLVAGSRGKKGAALLAAEACLRAGTGLLTVHSTADTLSALSVRHPEAMSSEDEHSEMITQVVRPENYRAVAFGPGTGTHADTATVLKKILQHGTEKLVIDADGLNLLAENKTWLEFLPPQAILTPHPGEWRRLAGKADDEIENLELLREFSRRHGCIVVLKGAHSCIAMPDGNLFFNSSGNPGLAKGGTGDALTGLILGLLSSGYTAPQAAIIGVFVHGLAADLCLQEMAAESMLATDVIRKFGTAFSNLRTSSSK